MLAQVRVEGECVSGIKMSIIEMFFFTNFTYITEVLRQNNTIRVI